MSIPLGPYEAMAHIDNEACCMADHIVALIRPCTALGVLMELDAVKLAIEALHDAARKSMAKGVH